VSAVGRTLSHFKGGIVTMLPSDQGCVIQTSYLLLLAFPRALNLAL
jgi:hypothetical protein